MFENKILSLFFVKDEQRVKPSESTNLFCCGPEGVIIWWRIFLRDGCIELSECGSFTLPYCRQRWATSVLLTNVYGINRPAVVCGDRRGSLHVFDGKLDITEVRLALILKFAWLQH